MTDYHRGKKSGRWTQEDKDFISANCNSMNYEDIAEHLGRNPDIVKKYIRKTLNKKTLKSRAYQVSPEYNIKQSPVWQQLKREFSSKELDLFLYHWARFITQFKDDVFPTEELQIIDAIRVEILLSRTLEQQQQSMEGIAALEAELKELTKSSAPGEEIKNVEYQLNAARAAIDSMGKAYVQLLDKKDKILNGLKATRQARIEKIENSKQTVLGWMAELIRNKDMRNELGLYMEKTRLAIDVEKIRLMDPHKYVDNVIDYPILNAETIQRIHNEEAKEEGRIEISLGEGI